MEEAVELVLATQNDAELLHQMKYFAFLPLYEKYHDDEVSPVKEPINKIFIQLENSDYYLIKLQNKFVGGVRVVERKVRVFYISPIFILPEFQNQGMGFNILNKLFDIYEQAIAWRLTTILEEKRNCHLYEKCGFVKTGKEKVIHESMTLIDYEKKPSCD